MRNGDEADTNHGADTLLIVKDGSDEYDRNAYIRFDLPSVSGPVVRAILTLTVERLPNGEPAPVKLYVSDNNWQEDTITWNNRPPINSAVPFLSAEISQLGDIEFDITDYINATLDRGERSITLVIADGTTARRMVRFWSREGTTPPRLELKFR